MAQPIIPSRSCSRCVYMKNFVTETTLCMHPKHIKNISNAKIAEKCDDFQLDNFADEIEDDN